MEVRAIRMPSRLYLRLYCFIKGVNIKKPKCLAESIISDYLNNKWVTTERLAYLYGFSEKKLISTVARYVRWG
jgi:hypothetical protein